MSNISQTTASHTRGFYRALECGTKLLLLHVLESRQEIKD